MVDQLVNKIEQFRKNSLTVKPKFEGDFKIYSNILRWYYNVNA